MKCGKHVDAEVCTGGFRQGPKDGQREYKYQCKVSEPYAQT